MKKPAAIESAYEQSARSCGRVKVPVRQFGLKTKTDTDTVAVEEPLEIRLAWPGIDGTEQRQIAVTMRTPGDDFDLATGFLFTEGIIHSPAQLQVIERVAIEHDATGDSGDNEFGNIVLVNLDAQPQLDLEKLERNFYVSSSCGVCGKASIDAIKTQANFPISDDNLRLTVDAIAELPEQLRARQTIFTGTGGIHAAALFDGAGLQGQVFEDVGRHNAVDKLLGAQFRAGMMPLTGIGLLVSGRVSFELVQKARMAGCAMLAAVGAPSSLAIELAWESDMTLIGFLRDKRFNVYTGPARIV